MEKIFVSDAEAIDWFRTQWLEEIKLEDKSETKIVFLTEDGVKEFTPFELYMEMKRGTEIGRKHLEIIKNFLAYKRSREVEQK